MAKRTWKDRVLERPRTFNLQNNADGTITLIPAPGQIVEVGTPVNAANLNGLETDVFNHIDDDVNHVNYVAVTGSANTYVATLNPAPASLVDGLAISIKINVANIGASTLNVNSLGAKPIKKGNLSDVTSSQLKAGGIYTLRYNATTGNFILQGEGGEYGTATKSQVLSGYTIGTEEGIIVGDMPIAGDFPNNVTALDFHPYGTTKPNSRHNLFVKPPYGWYNGVNAWVGVDEPDLIPANIANGKVIGQGMVITGTHGLNTPFRSTNMTYPHAISTLFAYATAFVIDWDNSYIYLAYALSSGSTNKIKKYNFLGDLIWDVTFPYDSYGSIQKMRLFNGSLFITSVLDTYSGVLTIINTSTGSATNAYGAGPVCNFDIDNAGNYYVGVDSPGGSSKVCKYNSSWVLQYTTYLTGLAYISQLVLDKATGDCFVIAATSNGSIYHISPAGALTLITNTVSGWSYYSLALDSVLKRVYIWNRGVNPDVITAYNYNLTTVWTSNMFDSGNGASSSMNRYPIQVLANGSLIFYSLNSTYIMDKNTGGVHDTIRTRTLENAPFTLANIDMLVHPTDANKYAIITICPSASYGTLALTQVFQFTVTIN